jgi:hypothetical protein
MRSSTRCISFPGSRSRTGCVEMEQKYKRFAHVCMCVYAHVLSNVFLAHVLRSNTCAHVLSNVFLSSFVHQPNATVHQSSLNTLEHACTQSSHAATSDASLVFSCSIRRCLWFYCHGLSFADLHWNVSKTGIGCRNLRLLPFWF